MKKLLVFFFLLFFNAFLYSSGSIFIAIEKSENVNNEEKSLLSGFFY